MSALILLASLILNSRSPMQADPKITLTVQAMRADEALDQLSNVTGISLTASQETANEIITFRLRDVSLHQAMNRIAEAVDGTWKQDQGNYRLTRTPDQLRSEKGREFAEDAGEFQDSVQAYAADLRDMAAWTTAEADSIASDLQQLLNQLDPSKPSPIWNQKLALLAAKSPTGRLAREVAAAMNPTELAGLAPFTKTVWSTHPTAVQRKLPDEEWPVVNRFVKEFSEMEAAGTRYQLTAPTENAQPLRIGPFGSFQHRTVGTVLLSAWRQGISPSVQMTISVYDEKGEQICRDTINIGKGMNGNNASEMRHFREDIRGFGQAQSNEKQIVLEGDAKMLASDWRVARMLKGKIEDPAKFEPLAYFLSPALVKSAEIRGVNMAACLSDNWVDVGSSFPDHPASVNQLITTLCFKQAVSELHGEWMIVRPRRPYEVRTTRVGRGILANYLREIDSNSKLPLNSKTRFAWSLPVKEVNNLPYFMAGYLKPQDSSAMNSEILKLYGLISPSQMKQMVGAGLSLGELTDAEAYCLSRMIYGEQSFLRCNFPPETTNTGIYTSGILNEPTEALPNGIPPNGLLKMEVVDSSVVAPKLAQLEQSNQPTPWLTARQLAFEKASQENPERFPGFNRDGHVYDLNELTYQRKVKMTFTFQLTSILSIIQQLEDNQSGSQRMVTLDTLPDDFKKQFDQVYKALTAHSQAKTGESRAILNSSSEPASGDDRHRAPGLECHIANLDKSSSLALPDKNSFVQMIALYRERMP